MLGTWILEHLQSVSASENLGPSVFLKVNYLHQYKKYLVLVFLWNIIDKATVF